MLCYAMLDLQCEYLHLRFRPRWSYGALSLARSCMPGRAEAVHGSTVFVAKTCWQRRRRRGAGAASGRNPFFFISMLPSSRPWCIVAATHLRPAFLHRHLYAVLRLCSHHHRRIRRAAGPEDSLPRSRKATWCSHVPPGAASATAGPTSGHGRPGLHLHPRSLHSTRRRPSPEVLPPPRRANVRGSSQPGAKPAKTTASRGNA